MSNSRDDKFDETSLPPTGPNTAEGVAESPSAEMSAEEHCNLEDAKHLEDTRDLSSVIRLAANDPDFELVKRAQNEDELAFEELVKRHQDRLFSRIYFMVRDRGIAEDLAQEAFLRAFMAIKDFRHEAQFKTWLGRIGVNVALHHIERRKAQKRSGKECSLHMKGESESWELPIQDPQELPEERAMAAESHHSILLAIQELPDEYRIPLTLRDLHDYNYYEIAEAMFLPIGTIKSRIFRARQTLQTKLKGLL